MAVSFLILSKVPLNFGFFCLYSKKIRVVMFDLRFEGSSGRKLLLDQFLGSNSFSKLMLMGHFIPLLGSIEQGIEPFFLN